MPCQVAACRAGLRHGPKYNFHVKLSFQCWFEQCQFVALFLANVLAWIVKRDYRGHTAAGNTNGFKLGGIAGSETLHQLSCAYVLRWSDKYLYCLMQVLTLA